MDKQIENKRTSKGKWGGGIFVQVKKKGPQIIPIPLNKICSIRELWYNKHFATGVPMYPNTVLVWCQPPADNSHPSISSRDGNTLLPPDLLTTSVSGQTIL